MSTVAEAPQAARRSSSVINLSFRDKTALFGAYMPYVQNGGLFVATDRDLKLGDELFLLVALLDDPARIAIQGKVVWITPAGVAMRPQGAGVQFKPSESTTQARAKIETLVGAAARGQRPSFTI